MMSRATPSLALVILLGCGDSSTDPTGDPTTSATADLTDSGSTDTTGTDTTGPTTANPTTTAEPTTDPTTTATTDTTTTATTDPTTTAATDATTGTVTADCGFDPGLPFDRQGPIWQLVSDDGETCVLLERRDDSEPDVIYKAIPYTLLSFKIGHAGVVSEYTELAQLHWESTHHNWLDVAEAWDSDVRYRLAYRYGDDFLDEFDLGASDEQTKAPLWGPISLYPYVP